MSSKRLVCFLSALCISVLLQNAESRLAAEEIVGGDLAREGQFPYQVYLYRSNYNNHVMCGGAIISENHILTAAHCVMDYLAIFEGTLKVKVGVIDATQCSEGYEVQKIYTPWQHTPRTPKGEFTPAYDVAVLKLSQSLDLSAESKLRALKLPEQEKIENPVTKKTEMHYPSYQGQKAILTGFGWNVVEGVTNKRVEIGSTDEQMRYAEVEVLSIDNCGNYTKKDTTRIICARVTQRENMPRGACQADSGSPLAIGDTIIGVLSASPVGCQENKQTGKYARVSKLVPFIKNAMNETDETKMRVVELNAEYKLIETSRDSEMATKFWVPTEY